ncbi:MAG: hypothetical protein IPM16_14515 [Chloroflexi bacterium]|nr:hypothetical protein [Chloroflexota bacterium]
MRPTLMRHHTVIWLVFLALMTALPAAADPVPRAAPPNDNFADAVPLVLNTRVTVEGNVVEATLETAETNDIDFLSCPMSYTVWYSFTPTFSGTVLLSTAGSEVYTEPYQANIRTVLGIYTGTTLDDLTQTACAGANLSGYGELPAFGVSPGTTYYVRVGLAVPNAASATLKLRTMVHGGTDWDPTGMLNTSFETPLSAADWKVENASNGDGQECGVVPAYDGACVFKFVGGPNEATKLKQKRDWPVDLLLGYVGHRIEFSGQMQFADPANLKFKIILKYSDGTPSTKAIAVIDGTSVPIWKFFKAVAFFASPNVSAIKLVIRNATPSGSAYIDFILLDYDGGYARTVDGAPLPVPAPPQ